MRIDGAMEGDVLVLRVGETRIDAASAVTFKERVRTLIAGHDGPVTIDMARVDFLDSSGLGALVAVMKMLGGDRRLCLRDCSTVVGRVLSLTRMDRVFDLEPRTGPAGRDAA